MISASREVNGHSSISSDRHTRVRYNGNAFGGFHMSDSHFPRKSNLSDRKHMVLKIAAENFNMVRRLQRVQSSVGRMSNSPASDSKFRSRPRSSFALSYPNVIDPSALPRSRLPHRQKQAEHTLVKSRTQGLLVPLEPQVATSEAFHNLMKRPK